MVLPSPASSAAPFSPAHMALLRPLPTDPRRRRQQVGRWLEIAGPEVERKARRAARRRGLRDDARCRDIATEALSRTFQRVVAGRYDTPDPDRDDRTFVLNDVDNFVRAVVRSIYTEAERTVVSGELAEAGATVDAVVERHWAVSAQARREADLIREVVDHPVHRLVVLLAVHPQLVGAEDVDAAAAASRDMRRGDVVHRVGLTRSRARTWAMLQGWLRPARCQPAEHRTAWLAWILRGPADREELGGWTRAERRTAMNWLTQQRSRGRVVLRRALAEPRST